MDPTQFLEKVWKYQAQDGYYFFLSTKSVRTGRWKDHPFKWPISRFKLRRFFRKYSDEEYHLYFCPLPFHTARREKRGVAGSRLLWADLDEATPRKCDPIPQVAWESSPRRFSALWILNSFHSPLAIEPVNKSLTYNSGADAGGWDLTQVLRIPGCKNAKYNPPPMSELMWFRNNEYDLGRIPDMQIETLDPEEVYSKYKKQLSRSTIRTLGSKVATRGKRSDVIWKLENELTEAGLSESEVFSLIKASVWNKFRGRPDEDIQLQREVSKAAERRPAMATVIDREDGAQEEVTVNGALVRLSDVQPRSVDWLWYPYIPRAKLTLIEGDPSVGKSWVSLVLARHLSRRIPFPGTTKKTGGLTLLLSAEDGLADTIRPRLDRLGVDARKVFAYNSHITLDEDGLEELEEEIGKVKPACVIIDPLVAYMGGSVDLHRANEIREMTAELADIAERQDTSIIAIRHLRKGSADKSIYRGIGSIDLTAAARSVLLVGRNPNDQDQRAIVHIKSNLGPMGETQTYRIEEVGDSTSPFRWTGTANISSEDVLKAPQAPVGPSERELAKKYLEETLKVGRKRKDILLRDGEARGIGKGALFHAKKELGIKEKRRGRNSYWAYPV